MSREEKIDYLVESIENLIDAKCYARENDYWKPLYDARADIKEALEFLILN